MLCLVWNETWIGWLVGCALTWEYNILILHMDLVWEHGYGMRYM